jgi:UDP-2,3-diacylglucosamine hydrolase
VHKTYFTSDLHLFARRSDATRHRAAIASLASDAKEFVLGGDIFDFHWATMGTLEEAEGAAIDWLAELAAECPQCHFHFLLGNHDGHQAFINRLIGLELVTGNMSWHRFYVRIGNAVFLHGDVADRKMDADTLAASRRHWDNHRPRGQFLHLLYDLVVWAKIHRPIPYMVYPKRTTARRILSYLVAVNLGPAEGVRNVYFGHTHRELSEYHYGGLTFHNGGAPIKGLKFRIVEAEVG